MGKESIFEGAGEMQARCRALDWSATSLGDPSGWPPALRVIVQTALTSPFPMNLWCGDDLVLIYNDAYRRVLGDKHPHALGRPGWEVWSEIWPQIQPMFEQIRIGMVAPQAAQKGVQLSSLCADAPPFLADPDRLRQILLNLLTNAIKFTPAGGSISVRCHGDDTHAYIQVEDTGQGIAPDQQQSIFQAFVQADGGYTRRAGGTGLGLTISRHLALLMNGDLTVSSRLGRGSCFVLRLPRSPDGASDRNA